MAVARVATSCCREPGLCQWTLSSKLDITHWAIWMVVDAVLGELFSSLQYPASGKKAGY